jgi:hypothetical protein
MLSKRLLGQASVPTLMNAIGFVLVVAIIWLIVAMVSGFFDTGGDALKDTISNFENLDFVINDLLSSGKTFAYATPAFYLMPKAVIVGFDKGVLTTAHVCQKYGSITATSDAKLKAHWAKIYFHKGPECGDDACICLFKTGDWTSTEVASNFKAVDCKAYPGVDKVMMGNHKFIEPHFKRAKGSRRDVLEKFYANQRGRDTKTPFNYHYLDDSLKNKDNENFANLVLYGECDDYGANDVAVGSFPLYVETFTEVDTSKRFITITGWDEQLLSKRSKELELLYTTSLNARDQYYEGDYHEVIRVGFSRLEFENFRSGINKVENYELAVYVAASFLKLSRGSEEDMRRLGELVPIFERPKNLPNFQLLMKEDLEDYAELISDKANEYWESMKNRAGVPDKPRAKRSIDLLNAVIWSLETGYPVESFWDPKKQESLMMVTTPENVKQDNRVNNHVSAIKIALAHLNQNKSLSVQDTFLIHIYLAHSLDSIKSDQDARVTLAKEVSIPEYEDPTNLQSESGIYLQRVKDAVDPRIQDAQTITGLKNRDEEWQFYKDNIDISEWPSADQVLETKIKKEYRDGDYLEIYTWRYLGEMGEVSNPDQFRWKAYIAAAVHQVAKYNESWFEARASQFDGADGVERKQNVLDDANTLTDELLDLIRDNPEYKSFPEWALVKSAHPTPAVLDAA